MSQQVDYLTKTGTAYILSLINKMASISEAIDDINIRQDGCYSSYKINDLLTTLKTELQNDYRSLISNLNRLKKLIVTSLPTTDIDLDTLYMLKKTDGNGDEYIEQYLYLNSTWELVATSKVTDDNGLEIYDSNKQYVLNDTVLYKSITDTYYSIYICTNPTTGTFVDSDWEIVDEKQEFVSISTTQPSNVNLLWIDITDSTKPLLKFHNGTSWVTISGNGSGSGISQYADYNTLPLASQGSTSSDLVDNKIVFCNDDYTDSTTRNKYPKGFYKYTSADDDWTEIYKFDFEEGVKQLKNYIVETNLRTYTGEELGYGEFKLNGSNTISMTTNMTLPITKTIGTLEANGNNIKLLANRTYEISLSLVTSARVDIRMYDASTDTVISELYTLFDHECNCTAQVLYKPDNDIEVYFKTTYVTSGAVAYVSFSSIIVREINRQVIIDPAEICEEQKGIEAVPVGQVIDFVGTQVPEHYLFADGKEYNIADYPKLAQHILDNYGSVNAFGGDGITTFAVPNKIDDDKITWYDIVMTSNNTPSPYVVSYSSRPTDETDATRFEGFQGIDNDSSTYWNNYWDTSFTSAPTDWWQLDFGYKATVSHIKFLPFANYTDLFAHDLEIQGSNDGTTFDSIKSFVNNTIAENGKWLEFKIPVSMYRYFRIVIKSNNSTRYPYSYCFTEIKFGIADAKLIKAEPTYNISTIGDTINPNVNNTDTDFRLDIIHAEDGTVETTPNLKGRDAVYVPTNGFYNLEIINGTLYLTCEDEATPPPLSMEHGNLYYTVGGTIKYVSVEDV